MPPSSEDRLRDMRDAISELETFLEDIELEQFATNRGLRLITERLLEIICEAAHHLPGQVKAEATGIDWRKMADFANRLRHAYHSTETEIVWNILQNHLPHLKAFVESRIRE